MGDFGFSVSKPGYNVKTATIAQLIFSSKYNGPKIAAEGTVSHSSLGAGSSTTKSVAHGFSFTPAFIAWIETDNSGDWSPMYYPNDDLVSVKVYSNSSYVYFYINNQDTSSHNIVVYYAIFADRAG